MTITTAAVCPQMVEANGLEIYVDQLGQGPDVLLIGGLGDTVESWQPQLDGLADRYRLTAFDDRGAGRTAMPEGPVSVATMADDAAGVLRALDVRSAHIAGFSGGSHIAQELALRHADLVRSLVLQSTWPALDPYFRSPMPSLTPRNHHSARAVAKGRQGSRTCVCLASAAPAQPSPGSVRADDRMGWSQCVSSVAMA